MWVGMYGMADRRDRRAGYGDKENDDASLAGTNMIGRHCYQNDAYRNTMRKLRDSECLLAGIKLLKRYLEL